MFLHLHDYTLEQIEQMRKEAEQAYRHNINTMLAGIDIDL